MKEGRGIVSLPTEEKNGGVEMLFLPQGKERREEWERFPTQFKDEKKGGMGKVFPADVGEEWRSFNSVPTDGKRRREKLSCPRETKKGGMGMLILHLGWKEMRNGNGIIQRKRGVEILG